VQLPEQNGKRVNTGSITSAQVVPHSVAAQTESEPPHAVVHGSPENSRTSASRGSQGVHPRDRWRSVHASPTRPLRLRSRHFPADAQRAAPLPAVSAALQTPRPAWAQVWEHVQGALRTARFGRGTRTLYRQVLRGFVRHLQAVPPVGGILSAATTRGFVEAIAMRGRSWSWLAANISVLRTVLDKLGGGQLTADLRTPRRPRTLPDTLSAGEIDRLLAAGPTLRDQLLLGLLYGCGLKVGELCSLRWGDFHPTGGRLRVHYARGTRTRELAVPEALRPLMVEGLQRCGCEGYVLQGRTAGRPLSTRMAQRVVREARLVAGIERPISAMVLRHSFALHCLDQGDTIRAVQEALGHQQLESTLRYARCRAPRTISPVDRLAQTQAGAAVPAPPPLPMPAVNLGALELPFRHPAHSGTETFRRALKVRLGASFMASRRPEAAPPRRL
jgi:integrase/recombinase XerD